MGERAWLPWNAGFLRSEKQFKHVAAPTAKVKSRSQRQVKTGSTAKLVFSFQWKHQLGVRSHTHRPIHSNSAATGHVQPVKCSLVKSQHGGVFRSSGHCPCEGTLPGHCGCKA